MNSTLIVLALLVLAVGIVVWFTRRKPGSPPTARGDQDTGWNDPVTPAKPTPKDPHP